MSRKVGGTALRKKKKDIKSVGERLAQGPNGFHEGKKAVQDATTQEAEAATLSRKVGSTALRKTNKLPKQNKTQNM